MKWGGAASIALSPSLFQFYVYFGYFTLLAVVYLLAAVSVGIKHSCRKQPAELALAKEPCQLAAEVLVQDKSLETGVVQA